MAPYPEYIYSQHSAESAGYLVATNYGLRTPVHCKFYVLGLHDNYLIECEDRKYILRIYRNEWRTAEEALFELELLFHLGKRGAPVAGPMQTITGELAFRIESPEGERMAALFCYAAGYARADAITIEECQLLGHAVANVHDLAETFETIYKRQALDLPYLLDESIATIEPFIGCDGLAFLSDRQTELHAILQGYQRQPAFTASARETSIQEISILITTTRSPYLISISADMASEHLRLENSPRRYISIS